MKKSTIIIFFAFAIMQTQAQDYMISFAASGDTTGLATIKVDNITSGASVTLAGGDVLHLIPSVGIGTPEIENRNLQISPNPMVNETFLTFVAPEAGNASVSIVDLSGRTVCRTTKLLSPGPQSFRIYGIGQGVYFVNVTSKSYTCSTKLISQNPVQSEAGIVFASANRNIKVKDAKSTAETVDMPYTDGDILMYKGNAGQYSNVVTDVPTGSKTVTFNFIACTDSDGNHYATVQIGEGKYLQTWMAENLKVGVQVNGVQEQTNNGIIEKYCSADLGANCDVYGGLYQWGEMVQYYNGASNTTSWDPAPAGSIAGICPVGWHLPTEDEWCALTLFLDPTINCNGNGMIGTYIGGMMKETGTDHWSSPNTGATNNAGFTILPGGYRNLDGSYGQLHLGADYWPASELSPTQVWDRYFYYNKANISRTINPKAQGYSVRCMKD